MAPRTWMRVAAQILFLSLLPVYSSHADSTSLIYVPVFLEPSPDCEVGFASPINLLPGLTTTASSYLVRQDTPRPARRARHCTFIVRTDEFTNQKQDQTFVLRLWYRGHAENANERVSRFKIKTNAQGTSSIRLKVNTAYRFLRALQVTPEHAILRTTGAVPDFIERRARPGKRRSRCQSLRRTLDRAQNSIQSCTQDSDCGQVLDGTGCGCDRTLVARVDASPLRFYQTYQKMLERSCLNIDFITICSCAPVDGFRCQMGQCTWNRVPVEFEEFRSH